MPTYYMNEGAFDLLDAGYTDRTVHSLEADLGGGDRLDLAVVRAKIPEGKSLRDVVVEHLGAQSAAREGFAILEQAEASIGGAPAIEVRVRWRDEGRVAYERQAHLLVVDAWVRFAASAPLGKRGICDEALTSVLASVRLRD